ncbi:MAG: hypothetical protein HRT82_10715 [Henriciella sp.]|nr:hypothetical protein [Henriciella sp.]
MLFRSVSAAKSALGDTWAWPNFQISELACRCGGRFCDGAYWHAPGFLNRLQALRDSCGQALIITSAHRCPQWNAAVGGAPMSRHKTIAVDILLSRQERQQLRMLAEAIGFTGIGLARRFLHLDLRPRPAVWYYPGSFDLWQT